jgi:hypothetical protein
MQYQLRVVLRSPRTALPLIQHAKNISKAIAKYPGWFASLSLELAQLDLSIARVDVAQVATYTRAKGTVQVRDAALARVVSHLKMLRSCVEQIARRDAANAFVIAHAAGMGVARGTSFVKVNLALYPGHVSGEVEARAKMLIKHEAHDWQYSLDGKTWLNLPSTRQSTTRITGLTPGTQVYVRHRALQRRGATSWSAAAMLTVR